MSHETIYRSLYVQTRGVLKKELQECLRSPRAIRRSRHATQKGLKLRKIKDAVPISERPPEVEDRAVPPPDMEMMRLCFGQSRKYELDKNGISVLGVPYQSDALQTYLRRKDPNEVDVRWHPKDIGAISVRMGDNWFEVPAKDSTLRGTSAQTWLTAVRQTSFANPTTDRLDNMAVREAIKAIEARNEQAKLASSLNLEDWTVERMKQAEDNLLAGIKFYDRKEPTQQKGVLGHEIPSTQELTGEPMDHRAPKKGKKAKAQSADQPSKPSNFTVEDN